MKLNATIEIELFGKSCIVRRDLLLTRITSRPVWQLDHVEKEGVLGFR